MDLTCVNSYSAMHTMFEMEERFGLYPVKIDGRIMLTIDNQDSGDFNYFLECWNDRREQRNIALSSCASKEEREKVKNEYLEWEWTFPRSIPDPFERLSEKEKIQK